MPTLNQRALNHIWFPCSQMKDYETLPPIAVKSAKGSLLTLEDDTTIIDAVSSWWCKSLGHRHPRLQNALINQLEQFEHIIGTNTVNETLTLLSEKLATLQPELDKVFYASDGSMAVEIALKMSLHARLLESKPKKKQFIALENGYHGETLGTLSVSDVGLYKAPYRDYCFNTTFLGPLPYVTSTEDPLWTDAKAHWEVIEKKLTPLVDTTTAIIVEPLVQGACGMKIYSLDFLERLSQFAKANDIHLICDEIMTGFSRTGKTLAIHHGNIQPDFVCLSKGLTGGNLALSAVLTSNDIYQLFYDDYETGKAFLHSNTYCGNALAASIAVEVLNIHEEEDINKQASLLGGLMYKEMRRVSESVDCLTNVRQLGAIVAAEINIDKPRPGFKLFEAALKHGAFIRPLGNTLYWLPPLNTPEHIIQKLANITIEAIHSIKQS